MRTVYPIGTTVYNPEKCSSGYTVLNLYKGWASQARIFQKHVEEAVKEKKEFISNGMEVIDMNGNIVHAWHMSTNCLRTPLLQKNGNVLLNEMLDTNSTGKFGDGHPREYDWEGNLIWECNVPTELHGVGGTTWRLENGNTLFVYKMMMPDSARLKISDMERRKIDGMLSDCIAEVKPDVELVWDWKSHDHLDLNDWCRNDPAPNWTHFNNIQALPENKHYDQGDKRFKPGNILVSGRSLGFIFIIEKETSEIVWRYYGDHLGGLAGQHSPFMIKKGYPGEGNILVFDNGQSPLRLDCHGGRSLALEINPVSSSVVWVYDNSHYFFNAYGGHCERLINGNTLIAESWANRAFEVTMDGEIVWEYVADPRESTLLMDVHRVPYDYCPQLAAMSKPEEKAVTPPEHTLLNLPEPCERKE